MIFLPGFRYRTRRRLATFFQALGDYLLMEHKAAVAAYWLANRAEPDDKAAAYHGYTIKEDRYSR